MRLRRFKSGSTCNSATWRRRKRIRKAMTWQTKRQSRCCSRRNSTATPHVCFRRSKQLFSKNAAATAACLGAAARSWDSTLNIRPVAATSRFPLALQSNAPRSSPIAAMRHERRRHARRSASPMCGGKRMILEQRQTLPLDSKVILTQRRIKEWYDHFNGDVYVSFSGGKDSTVLLDLVRTAPGVWDVPAVFCDTGLEYPEVREFAASKADIVLRPSMTFKADRKSTRLNSSHEIPSRMPSSA